jgi:hypothetical protein
LGGLVLASAAGVGKGRPSSGGAGSGDGAGGLINPVEASNIRSSCAFKQEAWPITAQSPYMQDMVIAKQVPDGSNAWEICKNNAVGILKF